MRIYKKGFETSANKCSTIEIIKNRKLTAEFKSTELIHKVRVGAPEYNYMMSINQEIITLVINLDDCVEQEVSESMTDQKLVIYMTRLVVPIVSKVHNCRI